MKRLAVLLIGLALAATACNGNVFSLSAGDCFDDPDNFGEVFDVPMVECSQPHDNEVFATFELPGSDYPGDFAVQTGADEGCFDRFAGYVGTDYETSTLLFSYMTPTSESWSQGDQEVVCFLYDLNGSTLTTSARGTGI